MTGAVKHDGGKARYDLIPPDALKEVARVFALGAAKYGDRNWELGMDWGRVYAAMQRHSWAWWGGEECDQEDGQHHLASVAWCALVLLAYELREEGKDTREPDEVPLSPAADQWWRIINYLHSDQKNARS